MKHLLITNKDDTKTVEVQKGDVLVVQLPENPTTGYRWSLDQHDPSHLAMQNATFSSAGAGIGAGGARSFTFVAGGAGETDLALSLRRPWERGSAARQSFRAKVRSRE